MRSWVTIAALGATTALAQVPVTGRVVDAVTGKPLPYCTVARVGGPHGTITNDDGGFRITLDSTDSLRFSFVGYTSRTLSFHAVADGKDVRLHEAVITLGEAVVRPDDELLERVIRVGKWIRRAPVVNARLFFGVETFSQGLPVEMIHAYYNAVNKGGALLELGLKNGRIGIAPRNGRFFVNYNTTKAFALIDITAEESPFPVSPLKHRSVRLLKKGFSVELVSLAAAPDGVDHLRVLPRTNNPNAFVADLWLEPGGDAVRALELRCRNCPRHPFRPLFEHGRIDTVDLRYKQHWSTATDPTPHVMQLDYRMVYSGPDANETFSTHALMHTYDRTSTFTLPLFDHAAELPDYRKIGWLPTDTLFWQRVQAPLPSARQQRDMDFLRMNDLNTGDWYEDLDNPRSFFKPPYAIWSAEHRLRISDLGSATVPPPVTDVKPDHMVLYAQFYLDLDTVNGALLHRSFSVADGYRTLVPRERLPWTDCFHNIWFDLCEMERRELETELGKPGMTLARAQLLYTRHTQAMQRMTQRLLLETGHGTRCEPLYRWNAVIKEALGIDNIALLGM
ncbi:MAG TPA: carboxypeptidase-like regulatory domain-containing protein [Flavobacteriales bacterium]|nr:carboxypeptidase-like regulatory domain-containing protein [Flavobacteriales bacterium]